MTRRYFFLVTLSSFHKTSRPSEKRRGAPGLVFVNCFARTCGRATYLSRQTIQDTAGWGVGAGRYSTWTVTSAPRPIPRTREALPLFTHNSK